MTRYPQTETIRQLFTKGQPLIFTKGEIIMGHDDEPDGVYFISTGYVKVYSVSDEGDEMLHIIYGHNEVFPLPWAYLGVQPSPLFYEAIAQCNVWRISREVFTRHAMWDRDVSYALSLQMATQFRFYADRIENLEYKRAGERVAYRLLFLASRFGVREGRTITIAAPLTHEIFASTVNLARESVSRELEKLDHDRIIKRNENHNIVILDIEALSGRLSRPSSFDNWRLFEPASVH